MPDQAPDDAIVADPDAHRSRQRPAGRWRAPVAIAALLLLLALGLYVVWPEAPVEPATTPAAAVAPPPPRAAAVVTPASAASAVAEAGEPPLAPAAGASAAALPLLEESDLVFARWLEEAFGREGMAQLRINDFARRFVTTVDNLGREHAPARLWPVNPAADRFDSVSRGGRTVIAPDNHLRYAPFVALLESVDEKRLAALYRDAYPLLQQAYAELGFPGQSFHGRLLAVIDHLLAAPEPAGEVDLLPVVVRGIAPPSQPWRHLAFADPTLEQLSAGQKLMVRMGLGNERRLKQVLTRLRTALTTPVAPR